MRKALLLLMVMLTGIVPLMTIGSVRGQELEWIRQSGTSSDETASSLSTDGNVYVAGNTQGTLPGQTSAGDLDAFVRKYGADGNVVWTRQFGTSGPDVGWGVSVDASGVYVAGQTGGTFAGQTSAGGDDIFVAKLAITAEVPTVTITSTTTLTVPTTITQTETTTQMTTVTDTVTEIPSTETVTETLTQTSTITDRVRDSPLTETVTETKTTVVTSTITSPPTTTTVTTTPKITQEPLPPSSKSDGFLEDILVTVALLGLVVSVVINVILVLKRR